MSPTNLQAEQWFPTRGLNLLSPSQTIKDMAGESYDVEFDNGDPLTIRKRDGYSHVNASAVSASPTLNGLLSLYLSNGTKYELIVTNGGGIWKSDSASAGANVFQTGTFNASAQPVSFTQFLDAGLFLDGASSCKSWDGSVTAIVTAVPSGAKYGDLHLNKFIVAGSAGNLSTVFYSITGAYNDFTSSGSGSFVVAGNDGSVIKSIMSFANNEALIWKNTSMWKVIGTTSTDFNLILVDKGTGSVSDRSAQNFRGGFAIWADSDGLKVYDGTAPKKISQYIQPFWDTIQKSRFEQMDSCIDQNNGLYYLSCSTSGSTNNRIVVVDMLHPWQDETGWHMPMWIWRVSAQSLNIETLSTGTQMVMGAIAGFKYLFSKTTYSDNGTAIEAYVDTPLRMFGDGLGMDDCLRRVYLPYVNTSGALNIYSEVKDGGDWKLLSTLQTGSVADQIGIDFTIGVSAVGATEITGTQRIDAQARSRRIKMRFYQSSATDYFKIQAPIELLYKAGGTRG